MSDSEFIEQVYNGLNQVYRGLGVILAAMARRYVLGRFRASPPPAHNAAGEV